MREFESTFIFEGVCIGKSENLENPSDRFLEKYF
jgi:hypothetical protein